MRPTGEGGGPGGAGGGRAPGGGGEPPGGGRPPGGGDGGGEPPGRTPPGGGGDEPPGGGGRRPPGGGDGDGEGGGRQPTDEPSQRTDTDEDGGTPREGEPRAEGEDDGQSQRRTDDEDADNQGDQQQQQTASGPSSGHTPGQPRQEPQFRNLDEVRDHIQQHPDAAQDRYINMSTGRVQDAAQQGELRPSGAGRGPSDGYDDIYSTRPGSGPHGYSYAEGTHVVRVPEANCVEVHHVSGGVFYNAQNQAIPAGQVTGKIAVFPGPAADNVLRYVTPDGKLRPNSPPNRRPGGSTTGHDWVSM